MDRFWRSRFSNNIRDYEGYSIGKLFRLLKDPDVISLAGGLPSPDIFLKEELRRATSERLEDHIDNIMQYSATIGEAELIKAILDFLRRDGISVSEENIVITSSGQQGLDLAGRLLLDPGDIVLVDRPTFAGALVAFRMQSPSILGVDIEEDGSNIEGFRKRIKKLEALGKRPKFFYVVPDFQNPTGITMSLEKREALLDLSYHYGIPIVEDSPYRYLRYKGKHLPSLFSLDQNRHGGLVIGLYTFSKLFCPGMRVGFAIGPAAVIEKMINIKEGSILHTPKYNQDMCAAFLTEVDFDSYMERCRAYYRDKLDFLLERMKEEFPQTTGVKWTSPQGGLFSWVSVPKEVDTRKLFYEAVRFKVAFVPGDVFYAQRPERHHMRINFSYPSREQLSEGIRRLSACIKSHLGKGIDSGKRYAQKH